METFAEALKSGRVQVPDNGYEQGQRSIPKIEDIVRLFFGIPEEVIEEMAKRWYVTDNLTAAVKMGRRVGLATLNLDIVSSDRELDLVERTAIAFSYMLVSATRPDGGE